jgi:hypothetical protein
MAKAKKTGYLKLSPDESIEVNKIMEPIISTEMVGDTKVATYAEGWTDQRVLEEVRALDKVREGIGVASISGLRKKRYGVFKPAPLLDVIEQNATETDRQIATIAGEMIKVCEALTSANNRIGLNEMENRRLDARLSELESRRLYQRLGEHQGHMNALFVRLAAVEARVGIKHANNGLIAERMIEASAK